MVQQFKETGHPILTATSALSRGILKQKERQNYHSLQWRFHEHRTIFQTINCVNQVSIYAAVTNWCYKFPLKEEKEHIPTPVDNRIMAVVLAEGNLMMQSEAKFRVVKKKVHLTQ